MKPTLNSHNYSKKGRDNASKSNLKLFKLEECTQLNDDMILPVRLNSLMAIGSMRHLDMHFFLHAELEWEWLVSSESVTAGGGIQPSGVPGSPKISFISLIASAALPLKTTAP